MNKTEKEKYIIGCVQLFSNLSNFQKLMDCLAVYGEMESNDE